MPNLNPLDITIALDLIGTFAFAISGIRLASTKAFDWFGAYVVGLVTAIGGGTTRDLLLDLTPFWMEDPKYLIVTALALGVVIVFKSKLFRWGNTLFIFDSIGLGLFTVSGIDKSLGLELPIWLCIMMGAISGSVGGVIRDVIINEKPLLFKEDLYALASILGGGVYFICFQFEAIHPFHGLIAVATVIAVRVVVVKYQLHLPKLQLTKKE